MKISKHTNMKTYISFCTGIVYSTPPHCYSYMLPNILETHIFFGCDGYIAHFLHHIYRTIKDFLLFLKAVIKYLFYNVCSSDSNTDK